MVQKRSLFIVLLVAAGFATPTLTGTQAAKLAQGVDNPDAMDSPDAEAAPTADSPEAAANAEPKFQAPAEGLPADASLTIEGTASMATITRSLVQAFEEKYPNATVTVVEQPADVALKNLQAGDVELIAIGRPLTAEQQAAGLVPVSVSREKIAIIVGTDNPFSGELEATDFVNIFWGTVTNWNQVGGPDLPIRFIDRPETSDTRAALGEYDVFGGDMTAGEKAIQVDSDSTAAVVAELGDNGISYAIASQVLGQENVRVLPMYGTTPDSGQYPYSQPRNYVYQGSEPLSPSASAFLALATDAEGQAVVAEAKAAEAADVAVADLPDYVSAMRPDGQGFVIGDRDGNLILRQADGTAVGDPIPAHTGPVTALTFSPDGQRLISGGADATLRWWDADGNPVGEPSNSGNAVVTSLTAQPDGGVISATQTGTWQRWDATGNPVGEPVAGHAGTVHDTALSTDGSTLITAGDDGTIRLWNLADGTQRGEPITGHQGAVRSLAVLPDGRFFSGGADGTVRQWAADGTNIGEPLTVSGPVTAIATNAAGNSIVVGDETGALQYLSGDGVPVGEPLTDVGAPVEALALSPDGQQLVVSAGDSPQLRDSTGAITSGPNAEGAEGDESGIAGNLPPQLQNLWGQLQGLPPQVLWIIPLALLAILLLGLLRSFQQETDDIDDDDEVTSDLSPTDATDETNEVTVGSNGAVESLSADDFSADDFSANDFATSPASSSDATVPSETVSSTAAAVPLAGFASDLTTEAIDGSLAQAKQTLQEGVSFGNAGRYQLALDRFNKAIELADMERLKAAAAGTTLVGASAVIARGLARRGATLANLGRSDEALKSLNRSLEMDPDDAAAWIGKGNVFIPMGQLDEALFCFDKAIELNPNLAAAWQGKGKALQQMGREAEARKCFQQATALGGQNDDIPLDLGTPAVSRAASSPLEVTPAPESMPSLDFAIADESASDSASPSPTADFAPPPPPAPRPTASPAAPDLPTDVPIGPIGLSSAETAPPPSFDEELPSDLLAAIDDLPTADQPPTETVIQPPSAAISPADPLPDTPETAIPEEILQAIDDLPAEPEDADPEAPLTNPVSVPPEVEAILAGESDLPEQEEMATSATAPAPNADQDEDETLVMPQTAAPAAPSAMSSMPAESPEPDPDMDTALDGLPPEVLAALEGIPADSPDSFGLSTPDTTDEEDNPSR
ncbi:substrate-binding domain-containing protein [Leptolyngbya iicbica]|uniref:Tetratricopeptide repeat protein n=2 Tax=Cyanophyceae TaxID=3028117 RepID=A0A4Q7EAL0_9CYAN|nr:substrate-binding domain-containing protein [Leptolyngbya sp. LK]RZM79573.1 tetratricopeptide repeat protein [Leptolyngbya sp. LK]